ncbi:MULTISPECIES: zinc-binding alcohol dehydrogenase family protein [Streptomyces]|uniref:Zinc-type alcohol dehydrogenase-like protein n=1 Tax=Streptomyces eurythermus TaxID=42237 RepID=A0ABW6YUV1_9ACTN|nr:MULTISPECIES: zinc-binding alcohol dehydrogenase family protein [Streptomyces]QIS68934.1 zinc-binding alcohol dehydrogenase family protein [Streptomyces sp. DSM 40868]WDM17074.1 zinc-binding alcohol dehydrogenase family protein [Streptomyces lavenduligriseus]
MNQTTMRAVGYRKSLPVDDAESLIDVELPVPEPGPRDLLVKVEAVAVNPVDYKVRQHNDPGGGIKVLGWDAAGTVVAVGEEVEWFGVGDEVYYAGALDRAGADSEYHTVDERIVALKPATLSFTEAAALPLTSLTAWEGLFEHLGLENGGLNQDGALLITAAAGGVGSITAQLARALTSLTVIGTASRPETVEFAGRMGVRHIIDHREPLVPQIAEVAPSGLTHVFSTVNTVGNLGAYAEALRPFGRIVAIDDFDSLPVGVLKPKSISYHWEFMFTRSMFRTADQDRQRHILTQVARLVDAGIITSTAVKDLGRINAANLREAHRVMESGTAIGKITLTGF